MMGVSFHSLVSGGNSGVPGTGRLVVPHPTFHPDALHHKGTSLMFSEVTLYGPTQAKTVCPSMSAMAPINIRVICVSLRTLVPEM